MGVTTYLHFALILISYNTVRKNINLRFHKKKNTITANKRNFICDHSNHKNDTLMLQLY